MSCISPSDNQELAGLGTSTGSPMAGGGIDPNTTEIGKRLLAMSYGELLNAPISEYFRVSDLSVNASFSHTLPRNGNKGLTANQICVNMHGLAINVLDPIRKALGKFVISSGFRNATGGSQHNIGCAADIYIGNRSWSSTYENAAKIIGLNGETQIIKGFDQFLMESGKGLPWLHISWQVGRSRGEYWNAKLVGDKTICLSSSKFELKRMG